MMTSNEKLYSLLLLLIFILVLCIIIVCGLVLWQIKKLCTKSIIFEDDPNTNNTTNNTNITNTNITNTTNTNTLKHDPNTETSFHTSTNSIRDDQDTDHESQQVSNQSKTELTVLSQQNTNIPTEDNTLSDKKMISIVPKLSNSASLTSILIPNAWVTHLRKKDYLHSSENFIHLLSHYNLLTAEQEELLYQGDSAEDFNKNYNENNFVIPITLCAYKLPDNGDKDVEQELPFVNKVLKSDYNRQLLFAEYEKCMISDINDYNSTEDIQRLCNKNTANICKSSQETIQELLTKYFNTLVITISQIDIMNKMFDKVADCKITDEVLMFLARTHYQYIQYRKLLASYSFILYDTIYKGSAVYSINKSLPREWCDLEALDAQISEFEDNIKKIIARITSHKSSSVKNKAALFYLRRNIFVTPNSSQENYITHNQRLPNKWNTVTYEFIENTQEYKKKYQEYCNHYHLYDEKIDHQEILKILHANNITQIEATNPPDTITIRDSKEGNTYTTVPLYVFSLLEHHTKYSFSFTIRDPYCYHIKRSVPGGGEDSCIDIMTFMGKTIVIPFISYDVLFSSYYPREDDFLYDKISLFNTGVFEVCKLQKKVLTYIDVLSGFFSTMQTVDTKGFVLFNYIKVMTTLNEAVSTVLQCLEWVESVWIDRRNMTLPFNRALIPNKVVDCAQMLNDDQQLLLSHYSYTYNMLAYQCKKLCITDEIPKKIHSLLQSNSLSSFLDYATRVRNIEYQNIEEAHLDEGSTKDLSRRGIYSKVPHHIQIGFAKTLSFYINDFREPRICIETGQISTTNNNDIFLMSPKTQSSSVVVIQPLTGFLPKISYSDNIRIHAYQEYDFCHSQHFPHLELSSSSMNSLLEMYSLEEYYLNNDSIVTETQCRNEYYYTRFFIILTAADEKTYDNISKFLNVIKFYSHLELMFKSYIKNLTNIMTNFSEKYSHNVFNIKETLELLIYISTELYKSGEILRKNFTKFINTIDPTDECNRNLLSQYCKKTFDNTNTQDYPTLIEHFIEKSQECGFSVPATTCKLVQDMKNSRTDKKFTVEESKKIIHDNFVKKKVFLEMHEQYFSEIPKKITGTYSVEKNSVIYSFANTLLNEVPEIPGHLEVSFVMGAKKHSTLKDFVNPSEGKKLSEFNRVDTVICLFFTKNIFKLPVLCVPSNMPEKNKDRYSVIKYSFFNIDSEGKSWSEHVTGLERLIKQSCLVCPKNKQQISCTAISLIEYAQGLLHDFSEYSKNLYTFLSNRTKNSKEIINLFDFPVILDELSKRFIKLSTMCDNVRNILTTHVLPNVDREAFNKKYKEICSHNYLARAKATFTTLTLEVKNIARESQSVRGEKITTLANQALQSLIDFKVDAWYKTYDENLSKTRKFSINSKKSTALELWTLDDHKRKILAVDCYKNGFTCHPYRYTDKVAGLFRHLEPETDDDFADVFDTTQFVLTYDDSRFYGKAPSVNYKGKPLFQKHYNGCSISDILCSSNIRSTFSKILNADDILTDNLDEIKQSFNLCYTLQHEFLMYVYLFQNAVNNFYTHREGSKIRAFDLSSICTNMLHLFYSLANVHDLIHEKINQCIVDSYTDNDRETVEDIRSFLSKYKNSVALYQCNTMLNSLNTTILFHNETHDLGYNNIFNKNMSHDQINLFVGRKLSEDYYENTYSLIDHAQKALTFLDNGGRTISHSVVKKYSPCFPLEFSTVDEIHKPKMDLSGDDSFPLLKINLPNDNDVQSEWVKKCFSSTEETLPTIGMTTHLYGHLPRLYYQKVVQGTVEFVPCDCWGKKMPDVFLSRSMHDIARKKYICTITDDYTIDMAITSHVTDIQQIYKYMILLNKCFAQCNKKDFWENDILYNIDQILRGLSSRISFLQKQEMHLVSIASEVDIRNHKKELTECPIHNLWSELNIISTQMDKNHKTHSKSFRYYNERTSEEVFPEIEKTFQDRKLFFHYHLNKLSVDDNLLDTPKSNDFSPNEVKKLVEGSPDIDFDLSTNSPL